MLLTKVQAVIKSSSLPTGPSRPAFDFRMRIVIKISSANCIKDKEGARPNGNTTIEISYLISLFHLVLICHFLDNSFHAFSVPLPSKDDIRMNLMQNQAAVNAVFHCCHVSKTCHAERRNDSLRKRHRARLRHKSKLLISH